MSGFEKFKEQLSSKDLFYSLVTAKKVSDKGYVLNVLEKLEMKTMRGYHNLYLKYNVLLSAYVFEKFRKNRLKIMDYVGIIIRAHQF